MIRAKQLTLAIASIGLAAVTAGCDAGGEPPAPGLAAEVEGATLDLDQVDVLTGAICTSLENDPAAQPTSRGVVQTSVVAQWVSSEVARELAEQQDTTIDVEQSDYANIPGWFDFSEEEQEAVRDYVDAIQYLQAAAPEVGDDEGVLDASSVDVTINPRYDLEADGAIERIDRQTSVAVSAEALAGSAEQLTPEQVADLPDEQICGPRTPAAPAPAIPQ